MGRILFIIICFYCSTATLTSQNEEKPNIVLILIDDLGWADLGFMGNTVYQTPNLDRLAQEGMVFNQAYAPAANCAPSRACIMSGKNTPFHGIYTVSSSERGKSKDRRLIPVPNKMVLHDSVQTMANFLSDMGYVTASMGKWHLGESPLSQGFDVNVAGYMAGLPKSYFSPYKNPNLEDGPDGEHLTDRLTTEALTFIQENKEAPFFLYLPHYTIHTPLQGKKHLVAKYEKTISDEMKYDPRYGAMVENMDSNVGRLLQGLDEAGVAENTIIIFTSDNGGLTSISSQAPLRAGKGSYYEGGIRVPLVVKWSGKIEEGKVMETPVSGMDLFPTIVDVLGQDEKSFGFDGVSLKNLLIEQNDLPDRSFYWHFPIYLQAYNTETDHGRDPLFRTRPGSVIRKGDWKLHEYFEDGGMELYNLADEIGERKNLVIGMPAKAQELHDELKAWRVKMGAPVPGELNPDFEEE